MSFINFNKLANLFSLFDWLALPLAKVSLLSQLLLHLLQFILVNPTVNIALLTLIIIVLILTFFHLIFPFLLGLITALILEVFIILTITIIISSDLSLCSPLHLLDLPLAPCPTLVLPLTGTTAALLFINLIHLHARLTFGIDDPHLYVSGLEVFSEDFLLLFFDRSKGDGAAVFQVSYRQVEGAGGRLTALGDAGELHELDLRVADVVHRFVNIDQRRFQGI